MIGMGHLQPAIKLIKASANDALLANGQGAGEIIGARAKENQFHKPGLI